MAAAKKETKTTSKSEQQEQASVNSGGQTNLTAALTYLAGWVTGLIFLLTEKDDNFIRFHAAQSLTVFGPLTLIAFVPILGPIVNVLLFPITLVLWIVLMVKAYQGERFKLPVVGDYAEQVMNKIGK